MEPSRFVAGLTPLPTAARVTKRRSALHARVASSIVSLVFLIVIVVLFRDSWSLAWTIAISVLWVLSAVFWWAISVIGLQNAKRDLAMIPEEAAFFLDPHGIEFVYPRPARVAWADVTAFTLKGHNFGAGVCVAVDANGEEAARVPVSFLDATPAIIDSAARAYSLGRVHLDNDALDRVI